jgi:hypothetical protein
LPFCCHEKNKTVNAKRDETDRNVDEVLYVCQWWFQ